MAVVVCDTSPLIHLARIEQFALLQVLYEQLLIPPSVWTEVVDEGRGRAGVDEVRDTRRTGWIEVHAAENEPLTRLLNEELDAGEAEAIALAIDADADLVLLDETQARRVATSMGLSVTGTLGVLIRAKTEGKITTLRPVLRRLRQESFWISDHLYAQVLEAVNE